MKNMIWITILFNILLISSSMGAAIPDTGQSKCYDVNGKEISCPTNIYQPLYGQDATRPKNPLNYIKLLRKGIPLPNRVKSWSITKDNVTGLYWETKMDQDGFTDYKNPHDADNIYIWNDSNPPINGVCMGTSANGCSTEDFLTSLNYYQFAGFNDWRLPTTEEMVSIIDYSVQFPNPAVAAEFFPNTQSNKYWTSTKFTQYTSFAWYADFCLAHFDYDYRSSRMYARAVRGNTNTSNTYTDNGDGTVKDNKTGLIWQKKPSASKLTWEQALSYCINNLGKDWRLPTIKELQSVVDYSSFSPSINNHFFSDAYPGEFWTSTTNSNATHTAWSVNFQFGNSNIDIKTNKLNIRPVRYEPPTEITYPQIGNVPGYIKKSLPADEIVELMINTTNNYQESPVNEWLFCTAILDGTSLPIYLISDYGAHDYSCVMSYLPFLTFSFDSKGQTLYTRASMADLGLTVGDTFIYAYCYENQSKVKRMDNIVFITVR